MATRMEHSHEREAIAERFASKRKVSYVRDFVYGGIDGAITTFAIVAGVMGAALSHKVILALGLANLFADGFSMAASNYAGVKASKDELDRLVAVEQRHISESPDGEKEEVRQLLTAQGITGAARESAVKAIAADRTRWINFMLTHEYGISVVQPSPWRAASATFLAFIICGFVPIAPFLLSFSTPMYWSFGATALVFLAIGAIKSRWSIRRWWVSGMETFFIGGTAAAVAYTIGILVGRLIES